MTQSFSDYIRLCSYEKLESLTTAQQCSKSIHSSDHVHTMKTCQAMLAVQVQQEYHALFEMPDPNKPAGTVAVVTKARPKLYFSLYSNQLHSSFAYAGSSTQVHG